jgi:hypothetical protein
MTTVVRWRIRPSRAAGPCARSPRRGPSGFVEEQDRPVGEDGAGDGDALALTAGQAHAALAQVGVVALGQARDELVGEGGAQAASRRRGWRRGGRSALSATLAKITASWETSAMRGAGPVGRPREVDAVDAMEAGSGS